MKLKFTFLLVASVATISQIANLAPAHADSTQIGRLVAQPRLLNSIVDRQPIAVAAAQKAADLRTARDLVAANRKTRKKIAPRKPRKQPAATTPSNTPSSQTPTAPAANQKQILVSDIIIKSPNGALAPELESKIRQVLTVKTGQPTTREQLEQNLNAIRALGAFSAVEIVPEDTSKGVKLSVLATPYGNLQQVQIQTLPANSSSVLKQADIDALFQSQYGKPLNAVELQAAIKQLNALYQNQGYNLAQVVEVKEPTSDGKLVLVIAEGLIEDVQVRFIDRKSVV